MSKETEHIICSRRMLTFPLFHASANNGTFNKVFSLLNAIFCIYDSVYDSFCTAKVLRHSKVKSCLQYLEIFPFLPSFFFDFILFLLFRCLLIKEIKFIIGQKPVQLKHLTSCALCPFKTGIILLCLCTVFLFLAYTDPHHAFQTCFCSRSNSFWSSTPSTFPCTAL